jgi:hypothetical protein
MNISGPGLAAPIQKLDDSSLMLRINQRITAEVMQISGDQVSLALENSQVVARLMSPDQAAALQERHQAQFIVRENSGQTIVLQLVNPDGGQQASGEAAPNLLVSLLNQNGIPLDKSSLLIARALVEAGLPVTAELVQELKNALDGLAVTGGLASWGQHEAQMAAILKAAGLPLSATALALALETPSPLQEMIAHLQEQLLQMGGDQPAGLAELVQKAMAMLNGTVVDLNATPSTISDQLQAILKQLGHSIENELVKTLGRGSNSQAGEPAQNGLLTLAALRQELAKHGTNPALIETLDRFLDSLRRMQFANLDTQPDLGRARWLSFEVPASAHTGYPQGTSPTPDNIRLRVACQRDEAQARLDPAHARIVIQFELEDGNALEVDLSLVERQIGATITSSSEEIKGMAETELPSLKDGLEKLGYQLLTARLETGALVLTDNLENQNHWRDFREINIRA